MGKAKGRSASGAVMGSGYGSANVKGPTAKPFSAKSAGGSRGGDPGGKYDVAPLGFQHNYSEGTARSIVKRLHAK